MALAEGPGPEQEHCADQLVLKWFADSRGVGAQQVDLERLGLLPADMGGGQSPEPGCDAVDNFPLLHRLLDDGACGCHLLSQVRPWSDLGSAMGDVRNLRRAERRSVHDHGVHGEAR